MPPFLPDRFEAGTPNVAGIFGLFAALQNKPEARHSRDDFLSLLDELASIAGLRLYRANSASDQGNLVSINIDGVDPAAFAMRLYSAFGIETRVGLHCAPSAHRLLGTYPEGTVRIAVSAYHDVSDFRYLAEAVAGCVKAL